MFAAVCYGAPSSLDDGLRGAADDQDGYVARENLANPLSAAIATDRQAQDCGALVDACALEAGTIPDELQGELASALRASDSVIRASLPRPFSIRDVHPLRTEPDDRRLPSSW